MKPVKEIKNPDQETRLSIELSSSSKERLKTIASIIVERIMEDQINGKLRFKNKT